MKELLFEKFSKLLNDINEGCALGREKTFLHDILTADLGFVFSLIDELARQEALYAFTLSADVKGKIVEIINQNQISVSDNLSDQDISYILITNDIKLTPEIIASIKELHANRLEALATYKSSVMTQAIHILDVLQRNYDWDRMIMPADDLINKWSHLLADNSFVPCLIYLSLKVYDDKCLALSEYIQFFSEHLALVSQQDITDVFHESKNFLQSFDKDKIKTAEIKLLKLIDYKVSPKFNADKDPAICPAEGKPAQLFTPEARRKHKRSDKNLDLEDQVETTKTKKAKPRPKG